MYNVLPEGIIGIQTMKTNEKCYLITFKDSEGKTLGIFETEDEKIAIFATLAITHYDKALDASLMLSEVLSKVNPLGSFGLSEMLDDISGKEMRQNLFGIKD